MLQPTPLATRRHALQILAGGALSLIPTLSPRAADAFRGWCRTDPIFSIEGQKVHLWVAIRWKSKSEAYRLSRGPVKVVLFVPPGVEAVRRDNNSGFGDGFDVAIKEAIDLTLRNEAIPVRLQVQVPFAKNVPARTWLRQLEDGPISVGGARGRTNEWIEFMTS